MIVEYLGIPGSGKTYQANLYKQELRQRGEHFIDLSRWKGMPIILKIFYKLTDKTFLWIPKYRKQRTRLRELCKNAYEVSPKYLPFSVNYCIDRIISSVFLQDVFGGHKTVAINDEGLMQWVVFLSIQYGVPINEILATLSPFYPNCETIYIVSPVETAFSNIKKRNRHVCPMDEMKDDRLVKYLEEFESACKQAMAYSRNF